MSKDTNAPASITEAERRKRQDAINFARASVGLEGFKISSEDEALAVRYVNGEIEISDVIESINEQVQRLR
jgi:hypothetical protein